MEFSIESLKSSIWRSQIEKRQKNHIFLINRTSTYSTARHAEVDAEKDILQKIKERCVLNLLGNFVKLAIDIITVLLLLIFWWILFINELWKRTDGQLRWRLQEHRPRHSGHLLGHSCSVKHTLVLAIAQNLQTTLFNSLTLLS